MNIGTIVTPMARGQITLPKPYREKLGIKPGTPLNVTLAEDKIVVQPLLKALTDASSTPLVIKPKYTRKQHLAILKKYARSKTVLWTDEDDRAREAMKKKEKYINW